MDKSQIALRHLGIIADGNRRWAKAQNLPTIEGHKKGLEIIEMLVGEAKKAGIEFVTFYVFSTENWGRSADEVSYIMNLAATRILKLAEKMAKNNVKFLVLGSKDKVNPKLASLIEKAEKMTANCDGITASFCFNYGGEQEIADAANAALDANEKITLETIKNHLYHPEVPSCDMIVRTSGEERISGFMLWRASYSEFMFIDKYFPDMTPEDVECIIKEYENRHRRFGK